MIGVFDSGYGGLTVLKEIVSKMPQYDYMYLGDNARSPYGSRSFETVYKFTLESVRFLFDKGCKLVILACNTASAKALRTIQQKYLPYNAPDHRVLGVIRPVAEYIAEIKASRVGIMGTQGTINSMSYPIEISKLNSEISVVQQACPLLVPLIENGEYDSQGVDYFVQKYINQLLNIDTNIDTLVLGCTHYPLLLNKIQQWLPSNINIVSQGKIVADKLALYLSKHPEIERDCEQNGQRVFYTTDCNDIFDKHASVFFGENVHSQQINLNHGNN